MVDRNKIATLDIEGDVFNKRLNQKLFPDGAHIDPNSRVWCATFTIRHNNKVDTTTFVCKLKGVRPIIVNERQVGWTKAEHYESTVIPTSLDTIYGNHSRIKECKDEVDLLDHVADVIWRLHNCGYKIYCKGYNFKYNYDALALYNSSLRLGWTIQQFNKTPWSALRNVCCSCLDINKYWRETQQQIQEGEWVSNQEYLEIGIKHNIEDSYQLFLIWDKYVEAQNIKAMYNHKKQQIKKMLEDIENDFSTSSK